MGTIENVQIHAKSSPAQRIRSATGPTGLFPGWKPTPEIAARWTELVKEKEITEELIQQRFVIHATKTLVSCSNIFIS